VFIIHNLQFESTGEWSKERTRMALKGTGADHQLAISVCVLFLCSVSAAKSRHGKANEA